MVIWVISKQYYSWKFPDGHTRHNRTAQEHPNMTYMTDMTYTTLLPHKTTPILL